MEETRHDIIMHYGNGNSVSVYHVNSEELANLQAHFTIVLVRTYQMVIEPAKVLRKSC